MASISSKWFGEGEKYARAVFTLASKIAPSVIFIDEVDRYCRSREKERERERILNHHYFTHFFSELFFVFVSLIGVYSILGRRDKHGEHEAMRKIKNEFMSMWDGLKTKVSATAFYFIRNKEFESERSFFFAHV
jgi:SpoVK/Ycf46/Vps4 family AAA+-type ATPase